VFPQFSGYDQVKNASFAGDQFNVGAGALEPAYAFGYDSGAGTYALDQPCSRRPGSRSARSGRHQGSAPNPPPPSAVH
jgi:hypothetical protein